MDLTTQELISEIELRFDMKLPPELVGVHKSVASHISMYRVVQHKNHSSHRDSPADLAPDELTLLALEPTEVDLLLNGQLKLGPVADRIAEQLSFDATEVANSLRTFCFLRNEKHNVRIVNE